ncbi:hypothetical protein Slin15195_G087580 [Septoria linicola]|uniref:Uncharacterized protein n=1 Tax=Septoria linicola TaxID=215465 RepID=A0A9Q9EMG3_9PEZI|nr:hypothetical protein Slin14017_G090170 [Septoria linicola]USW55439.1 hypothetical protein Slin15195_G087580 [Septoria linicola]
MDDSASRHTVYWPAGWARDRLVHASSEDIRTLSAEDSDLMFDSLRGALGPEEHAILFDEMTQNAKARERQSRLDQGLSANPLLDELTPRQRLPVLATLEEYCSQGPWGWVAYRTCAFDDEVKWNVLRKRFDAFIAKQFEPHIYVPEIKAAADRFKIHWVEKPELENASVNQVAADYRSLCKTSVLPEGLAHQMCLMIGDKELQAILDSPIPTPHPVHKQLSIPYASAVDASAGEDLELDAWHWEEHRHYTSFKVALSSLTDDLFLIVMRTIRSPRELSVGLADDKVYLSHTGRFGRFVLGVSQGDEAFSRR